MSRIIGKSLPNIPWQDKKPGEKMPVWRYDENPIIGRQLLKRSNSIFNSAVVPFGDGYAGVFRCDSRSVSMDIFAGLGDIAAKNGTPLFKRQGSRRVSKIAP